MHWYEDISNYYEDHLTDEPEVEFWDEYAQVAEDGVTLDEMVALASESSHQFMTAEDLYEYQAAMYEIAAERAAEQYYEDRGWQEAHLESLIESGLVARY